MFKLAPKSIVNYLATAGHDETKWIDLFSMVDCQGVLFISYCCAGSIIFRKWWYLWSVQRLTWMFYLYCWCNKYDINWIKCRLTLGWKIRSIGSRMEIRIRVSYLFIYAPIELLYRMEKISWQNVWLHFNSLKVLFLTRLYMYLVLHSSRVNIWYWIILLRNYLL